VKPERIREAREGSGSHLRAQKKVDGEERGGNDGGYSEVNKSRGCLVRGYL